MAKGFGDFIEGGLLKWSVPVSFRSIQPLKKLLFFGSILFFVFDLILVSFPKKVPLRTENSRKKGIHRRGGHALKRERHLASRGTRAGGQQNVVGGAKKKKQKSEGYLARPLDGGGRE